MPEYGSTPILLDLYCKAGGAAKGYERAGFKVVGVDHEPQPNYPYEFHQADALTFPLDGFDAIHASPPCQHYTTLTKGTWGHKPNNHPDLIPPTRERLMAQSAPWIMENVSGAPLEDPVRLCGSSFGLGVQRHRLFESSFPIERAPKCRHADQPKRYRVFDHGTWHMSRVAPVYGHGGGKAKEVWSDAMGIDWMSQEELTQAIPPAYTEWLGERLMAQICV